MSKKISSSRYVVIEGLTILNNFYQHHINRQHNDKSSTSCVVITENYHSTASKSNTLRVSYDI